MIKNRVIYRDGNRGESFVLFVMHLYTVVYIRDACFPIKLPVIG